LLHQYTTLGAGIWSAVLVAMGYFIGDNEALIRENLPLATAAMLGCVGLLLAGYLFRERRKEI
jgi:membrane protein DedA with SNARE-associated domain